MAKLARDWGIVLHTQDHAETDRIAVLLTPAHGRMNVLAKGARRLEQPSGAALDALNLVEAIFYRRAQMNLLREVSLVRTFPKVRADLDRLQAALWGIEWALFLLPLGLPDPRPFRLTLNFLAALETGLPERIVRLAYVLQLLAVQGHQPHLAGCVVCGGEKELTWSPDRGGLFCRACGGTGTSLPPRLWRTMDAFLRLPFFALGRLRTDDDTLTQAEKLLTTFAELQARR